MHVLVKIGNTYAPNEFIIKNWHDSAIDWLEICEIEL